MTARRTYLDYNATAPLRPEARAAMIAALDVVGNASSVHAEGRKARSLIETARNAVAALLGARSADVVFTSGASEANATVIAGGWDTIYLSGLEHDSVRVAAQKSGASLIELPVTVDGVLNVEAFDDLTVHATARDLSRGLARGLVCVQLANNETGVIQPVADVAGMARARGLRVHCDAVQAAGRIPVDCMTLGVDFLTVSAHKLGGPKGAGALVIAGGIPLPALIPGGQERGRRAGTENVASIAGFGAAATLAQHDVADHHRLRAHRDHLEAGVAITTPHVIVIGDAVPRLPNTTCIALPGVAAETVVIRLDLAGIAISAGAACSSGKVGQSAALLAQGLAPEISRGAIRVSLGHGTTDDDIAAFLAAWKHTAAAIPRAA
jgi:cysteine desulfurase